MDLSGSLAEAVRKGALAVERRKLEMALEESGGNRLRAAELLRVSSKLLAVKLREHRLE